MSRGKTLKTLVQERLTLAAEEIFELFEKVIAEYEEEHRRFKERSQANPEPQDFPTLQIQSVRGGVHFPSSPDRFPKQQITGTPQIKKEPDEHNVIKEEEDSLPVRVLQPSAVCVASEELWLQQKQGDFREDVACGEGIGFKIEVQLETASVTDDDEESEPLNIFSCARMETGFDGFHYNPDTDEPQFPKDTDGPHHNQDTNGLQYQQDTDGPQYNQETDGPHYNQETDGPHYNQETDGPHYNQVQIRDQSTMTQSSTLSIKNKSATKTTGTVTKKYKKEHLCTICGKTFRKENYFKNHLRIHAHTGKRPNSISNSNETFSPEEMLVSKARTHTSEKQFHDKCNLNQHKTLHAVEKPFCCSICNKTFLRKCDLNTHMVTHSNERPYTCSICNKTFRKECLESHIRTHTGAKPTFCSVCGKTFAVRSNLYMHKKTCR